jgi:spore germination protein YaaH
LTFYRLLRYAKKIFGKIDVKVGVALNRGRQLPTRIYEHVDRVHLLSYEIDLMGGAYHADFDKVRDTVKSFVTGNCPPKKLTIGLPLYSRITEQPGHMRTIDEMVTE